MLDTAAHESDAAHACNVLLANANANRNTDAIGHGPVPADVQPTKGVTRYIHDVSLGINGSKVAAFTNPGHCNRAHNTSLPHTISSQQQWHDDPRHPHQPQQ